MDADDSGVLLDWALKGCGVILVPRFEIVPFLAGGQLEHIPLDCTPGAVRLAMVYPHRDHQDPKIRVFIDYMAKQCKSSISQLLDE